MMRFYKSDASCMRTIIGANGKERTPSIADARKLWLFPSVTTVMDVQAKTALIEWLLQELLNAAVENPYHPHEWGEADWRKAMLAKMRTKSRVAADRGTQIHGKLDAFFNGVSIDSDEDKPYIQPALSLIEKTFGLDGWVSEKSFAATEWGFAGCVDLHHPTKNIVIDFKTKGKEDLKSVKQYDSHKMQLAAYQVGLGMPNNTRRFNLFIGVNENNPGVCSLLECTEFDRYWNMFYNLLMFWISKNKYDPRVHQL